MKWTIGIISTDYDLHDVRNNIIEELKSLKFQISAFEDSSFPVEPFTHSHEACLYALDRVDIVILIIDHRYGGLFLGKDGNVSITEKEFDKTISSNKIFIPCIRKSIWDERDYLSKQVKSLKKKYKDTSKIRKLIQPIHAQNWDLIDFIEKIKKLDTDNYLVFFDDLSELRENIIGRLQGISRFICQRIVESQIDHVRALKTTTGLALSVGDVLDNNYYVEPPFIIKSGGKSKTKKIGNVIQHILERNLGLLIIGEPGIGKSTVILKAFIENAKNSIIDKSYTLPFYVSLRGKGINYHFSFEKYIEDCFIYYLKKEKYPLLSITDIYPILFIDGFDELSDDYSNFEIEKVLQNDFFNKNFIASSRTRFAEINLNNITFGNKISLIVEIVDWDISHAKKYIRKFCNNRKRKDLISKIDDMLNASSDLHNIYINPLLLSLYLWIIEESGMEIPININDKISLYDKCLKILANRESDKLRIQESILFHIWMNTSWLLYKKRFTGNFINIDDIISSCNKEIKLNKSYTEIKFSLFSTLFIINDYNEITGAIHEQFLEFLVAKLFNTSLLSDKQRTDFFEIVLRPEINRIIRTIWSHENSHNKSKILDNLWLIYFNLVSSTNSNDISIRTHTIYHIGRMPISRSVELLKCAIEIEKNIAVRLSIYFGLIKKGDLLRESELFLLLQNEEWDRANRGYHLVYYSDWSVNNETPPYFDLGVFSWERTFKALFNHILSTREEHYFLRRIELYTIKKFCISRNDFSYLTTEFIQSVENVLKEVKNKEFDKNILYEFEELKRLL